VSASARSLSKLPSGASCRFVAERRTTCLFADVTGVALRTVASGRLAQPARVLAKSAASISVKPRDVVFTGSDKIMSRPISVRNQQGQSALIAKRTNQSTTSSSTGAFRMSFILFTI
jgi:hypothetical protein